MTTTRLARPDWLEENSAARASTQKVDSKRIEEDIWKFLIDHCASGKLSRHASSTSLSNTSSHASRNPTLCSPRITPANATYPMATKRASISMPPTVSRPKPVAETVSNGHYAPRPTSKIPYTTTMDLLSHRHNPSYSNRKQYETRPLNQSFRRPVEEENVDESQFYFNRGANKISSIFEDPPFGLTRQERKEKAKERSRQREQVMKENYDFRQNELKTNPEKVKNDRQMREHIKAQQDEYWHRQELTTKLRSFIEERKKKGTISPGDYSLKEKNGPRSKGKNIWKLDKNDVLSIREESVPATNEAVFRMFYDKIGNYNWLKPEEEQICLLDTQFYTDFCTRMSLATELKTMDVKDYASFYNNKGKRFILPILIGKQHSFVHVGIDKEKKVRFQQIDPSVESEQFVPDEGLREMTSLLLGDKALKKNGMKRAIKFVTTLEKSIQKQESPEQSDVLNIRNVEAMLRNRKFNKSLMDYCPKVMDDPSHKLEYIVRKERIRLANELDGIRNQQVTYEERLKQPSTVKSAETSKLKRLLKWFKPSTQRNLEKESQTKVPSRVPPSKISQENVPPKLDEKAETVETNEEDLQDTSGARKNEVDLNTPKLRTIEEISDDENIDEDIDQSIGPSAEEKQQMRDYTDEKKVAHLEYHQDGFCLREYKPEARPNPNDEQQRQRQYPLPGAELEEKLESEASSSPVENNNTAVKPDGRNAEIVHVDAPNTTSRARNRPATSSSVDNSQFSQTSSIDRVPPTQPIQSQQATGQSEPSNSDISIVALHAPPVSDIDNFYGHRHHFYLTDEAAEQTRTLRSQLSQNAVFRLLYDTIGNHNTHQTNAHRFALVHPDFAIQYFGAHHLAERPGPPYNVPIENAAPQFLYFNRAYKPDRIIMPIIRADHFALVVFGKDGNDTIRIHVMDSGNGNQSQEMISDNEAKHFARYYFRNAKHFYVERGDWNQVKRQAPGSQDCGIFTIRNAERYIKVANSSFGSIENMRLSEKDKMVDTSVLRDEYATRIERFPSQVPCVPINGTQNQGTLSSSTPVTARTNRAPSVSAESNKTKSTSNTEHSKEIAIHNASESVPQDLSFESGNCFEAATMSSPAASSDEGSQESEVQAEMPSEAEKTEIKSVQSSRFSQPTSTVSISSQQASVPTGKRQPTKDKLNALADIWGLRLKNNKDDCFLNVAINMFNTMSSFRKKVVNNLKRYQNSEKSDPIKRFLRLLAELFSRRTKDVKEFRSYLKGFEQDEQDVTEVFEIIVESLLKAGEECLEFRTSSVICVECTGDETHSVQYETEYEYSTVLTMYKESSLCTFQELFDKTQTLSGNCAKCSAKKAGSGENKLIRKKIIVDSDKYHIVSIKKNDPNLRFDLDGFGTVEMFEKKWWLIAFGELQFGHYFSWIKTKTCWLCLSDSSARTSVDIASMNLKNYGANILVFKRPCSKRVETKKKIRENKCEQTREENKKNKKVRDGTRKGPPAKKNQAEMNEYQKNHENDKRERKQTDRYKSEQDLRIQTNPNLGVKYPIKEREYRKNDTVNRPKSKYDEVSPQKLVAEKAHSTDVYVHPNDANKRCLRHNVNEFVKKSGTASKDNDADKDDLDNKENIIKDITQSDSPTAANHSNGSFGYSPSEPMEGIQTSPERSARPPATIEVLDMEDLRNSFFKPGEKDLDESEKSGTVINPNVVFLKLYDAIEDIYGNSTKPLALMHPDFVAQSSNPRWANQQESCIDAHVFFADAKRPKRLIMPILRYGHFALAVFHIENRTHHIRVHVKDSMHGELGDMFTDIEINQFAKRYYNTDIYTVTVERGNRLQVERQKDNSNDCGIWTISNALPYLSMPPRNKGLGNMKDLENPGEETDTTHFRTLYIQQLRDRYCNNVSDHEDQLSGNLISRRNQKNMSPPSHGFVENTTEDNDNEQGISDNNEDINENITRSDSPTAANRRNESYCYSPSEATIISPSTRITPTQAMMSPSLEPVADEDLFLTLGLPSFDDPLVTSIHNNQQSPNTYLNGQPRRRVSVSSIGNDMELERDEPMEGVQTSTDRSAEPPATINLFNREYLRDSFFKPLEQDLDETEKSGSVINSNVVFLTLYHAIEAIYGDSTKPLALIHPDFVDRLSNPEWVNLQEIIIDAHVFFAEGERPERVIMPILRYGHFALAVFHLESQNHHVRVHVKDSLHGEMGEMITKEEIEQFAKRYYNNDNITVTVERGNRLQVKRQKYNSNDCGICTLLNALPYLPMPRNEPLREMENLENPGDETETQQHRIEIAQELRDRYINKNKTTGAPPASTSSPTTASNDNNYDTNYEYQISEDVSSRPNQENMSPPSHGFVENTTEKRRRSKRKIVSMDNKKTKKPKLGEDATEQSTTLSKKEDQTDVKRVTRNQTVDFQKDFSDVINKMKEITNGESKKAPSIDSWNKSIEAVENGIRDKKLKDHRDTFEMIHEQFTQAIAASKKTKIHKKLQETYNEVKTTLGKLMKQKGYCCGHSYKNSLAKVLCNGDKNLCLVQKGQLYYYSKYDVANDKQREINFCKKHWQMEKDQIATKDGVEKTINKSRFKDKFHFEEPEDLVECKECGIKCHLICAGIGEKEKPDFKCSQCAGNTVKKIMASAKDLSRTPLSEHLEKDLNDFLEAQLKEYAILASVRVLYSNKKTGKKHELMTEYCESQFQFTHKFIAAFQVVNGREVIFFAMNVQEYDGNNDGKEDLKKGWVCIEWLDSVKHFQPEGFKGLSKIILNSYIEYVAYHGFHHVHIFASTPVDGDDYLFNVHPSTQSYMTQKKLQNWYTKTLGECKFVESTKHEADFEENDMVSVLKSLYFEGGFLDKILDDIHEENPNCKGDKLRKEIVKTARKCDKRLFYVKLREVPQREDEDRPIQGTLAMDQFNWLNEQMLHKWNFGTLREAHYATQMILERLIKEREDNEASIIDTGDSRFDVITTPDNDISMTSINEQPTKQILALSEENDIEMETEVKNDSDDDSKKATDTGNNIQITSNTRGSTPPSLFISKRDTKYTKSVDKPASQTRFEVIATPDYDISMTSINGQPTEQISALHEENDIEMETEETSVNIPTSTPTEGRPSKSKSSKKASAPKEKEAPKKEEESKENKEAEPKEFFTLESPFSDRNAIEMPIYYDGVLIELNRFLKVCLGDLIKNLGIILPPEDCDIDEIRDSIKKVSQKFKLLGKKQTAESYSESKTEWQELDKWFIAAERISELAYCLAVDDPSKLSKGKKGKDTYGEMRVEQMKMIIKNFNIGPGDVFVDMGSGIGQLVCFTAGLVQVTKAIGIEFLEDLAVYAAKIERFSIALMKFIGRDVSEIDLSQGTFLSEENKKKIREEATLIFVNNFVFDMGTDDDLRELFEQCRSGTRILSTRKLFAFDRGRLQNGEARKLKNEVDTCEKNFTWNWKANEIYGAIIDHEAAEKERQEEQKKTELRMKKQMEKRKAKEQKKRSMNKRKEVQSRKQEKKEEKTKIEKVKKTTKTKRSMSKKR